MSLIIIDTSDDVTSLVVLCHRSRIENLQTSFGSREISNKTFGSNKPYVVINFRLDHFQRRLTGLLYK